MATKKDLNMFSLKKVEKSYTLKGVTKVILEKTSFEFPRDKSIAIMGKNGAGKSTLMRMLSGAELPDKGRIIRHGNVSWPLGFAGGFNGSMTGIENIRFISRVYGQDTEHIIDYVQDFSELGDSLKLPISVYSSGMKARLAFGLSMAIHFDCYLIDEIMSVGDKNFKKKSHNVFNEKLQTSKIIMISHANSIIKEYCDCGIILTDGKIAYYDDVNEMLEEYGKS